MNHHSVAASLNYCVQRTFNLRNVW